MNESFPPPADHLQLFEYLRTLVSPTDKTDEPYPKFALVEAYWHLGRIIVETEQAGAERADYGIHLIELLSQRLTESLGAGYSLPNLWRFKQFYLAFQILSTNGRELPNLRQHLRTELSWSHYRLLMQLDNLPERTFYEHKAADERWTVRLLQKLVRSRFYFQTVLGENQLPAPTHRVAQGIRTAALTPLSSPIPTDTTTTRRTNRSRLAAIKKRLLERYVGYAFVAQRQYVSVDGQDSWADLVFFHYVINRFILIQLADHDLIQLNWFNQLLNAYNAKLPPGFDQPPLGLLIDSEGLVKPVTTSQESDIKLEDLDLLPQYL